VPVQMAVDSVRIDLLQKHRFVVLKDLTRERYLPIAIGSAEAGAIAIKLMNAEVLRPLTHDLICSVIATLGGRITRVLINDIVDGVFYARVVLDVDGRHIEVDSRPSDAIALAVRTNVPIFVDESVIERAGVEAEPAEGDRTGERESSGEGRISEEQLAAFRDVINQLNLDDLGK
jgi:bifunctional DNase/RNase